MGQLVPLDSLGHRDLKAHKARKARKDPLALQEPLGHKVHKGQSVTATSLPAQQILLLALALKI